MIEYKSWILNFLNYQRFSPEKNQKVFLNIILAPDNKVIMNHASITL